MDELTSFYKFDIVALSETWLKNNKTKLEYVQLDGYKSEFKKKRFKVRRRSWFLHQKSCEF